MIKEDRIGPRTVEVEGERALTRVEKLELDGSSVSILGGDLAPEFVHEMRLYLVEHSQNLERPGEVGEHRFADMETREDALVEKQNSTAA
jgi:hypothetical protein